MIRPSDRDGMATDMPLFRPSGKAKYFLFWGLTRFLRTRSDLPVGQFVDYAGFFSVIPRCAIAHRNGGESANPPFFPPTQNFLFPEFPLTALSPTYRGSPSP